MAPEPTPSRPTWVPAALAVSALLVLAVVGSAVSGSWQIEERFDLPTIIPPDITMPQLETGPFEPEVAPPVSTVDFPWLRSVAWVVLVAAGLALLWWLWTKLRDLVPAARGPAGPPPGAETGEGFPDLPALADGVAAAQLALDEATDPADAVIAAWLSLERSAEAAGVGRRPAQTPSEFTVAVITATPADPAHIRGLLALYHLARFSRHPIGPDERTAAAEHLAALAIAFDPAEVP